MTSISRRSVGDQLSRINALHLPLSDNGKRRAVARAEWYSVKDQPLQVHDVIA